jgi:colanic acid biosynthesis glycosyl transferase WcaI
MRVQIVTAVYPPEPLTSAETARDLAEAMRDRGHEVEVVSPFPNRPGGSMIGGVRRRWRSSYERDGYGVTHRWHTLSQTPSFLSRVAENISFGITSSLELRRGPAPDVVYLNAWPIFSQSMNTRVLARRGVPVVCTVKDLYPESYLNADSSVKLIGRVVSVAEWIDAGVYRRSAFVAVLNQAMADHLERTRDVPTDKLVVTPDWVDPVRFPRDPERYNTFRHKLGISESQFVATYAGSMTKTAGLELYLDTADLLRQRDDITIMLIGDGAQRSEIEELAEMRSLTNLVIVPSLAPDDVPEVQAAADVLLLSLMPGAAEHTTPSKLIYYLFSQRPVVAAVEPSGPPARIIMDAGCGSTVPQGDAHALAAELERLADDRQTLSQLGRRARQYAEAHFMKDAAVQRLCDLLERAQLPTNVGL